MNSKLANMADSEVLSALRNAAVAFTFEGDAILALGHGMEHITIQSIRKAFGPVHSCNERADVKELLEDCAKALREKAHDLAGQAPDLFAAEDTLEWSQALQVESLLAQATKLPHPCEPQFHAQLGGFKERADVLAFQQKFRVPMASEPSWMPLELFKFRREFLYEELREFEAAVLTGDMHGAADALVDLAYVLHGTALIMGLPWPMLWDEVQRKNMLKERAERADQSKRSSTYDVIKPAGWTPPDHTVALGAGPWPTLEV